jgi:hypothetical protein
MLRFASVISGACMLALLCFDFTHKVYFKPDTEAALAAGGASAKVAESQGGL